MTQTWPGSLEGEAGDPGRTPLPFDPAGALCAQVDPDLWFPAKGAIDVSATARELCGRCPLIAPCREYALSNPDEVGIWGGLTENDRRRIRRGQPTRYPPPRTDCQRVGQRRLKSCGNRPLVCDACRAGERNYQRNRKRDRRRTA